VQDFKNMALVVVVFMCLFKYVPHQKCSRRQRLMPTIQKLVHQTSTFIIACYETPSERRPHATGATDDNRGDSQPGVITPANGTSGTNVLPDGATAEPAVFCSSAVCIGYRCPAYWWVFGAGLVMNSQYLG